jgi:hypothetical protein
VLSRRRAGTVMGVSVSSTSMSASLASNQQAMVQAQLHLQEVQSNTVMSVLLGVSRQHHHHMLRNQYQTQTQNQNQAGSSSEGGDWSMGLSAHTSLSGSSPFVVVVVVVCCCCL